MLFALLSGFITLSKNVKSGPKPPIEDIDPVVTVNWLANNLGAPNLKIIHAGLGVDKLRYIKGHIHGSIFINVNWVMKDKDTKGLRGFVASKEKFEKVMSKHGISNNDIVVIYGNPLDPWVARLFWTFRYYGHERVGYLDGGIAKWVSKYGKESLVMRPPKTTPAKYSATIDESLRITGDYVKENLDNSDVEILDVRSREEYTGEMIEWEAERGGHVPGAKFRDWLDTLNPDGTFMSKAELKAAYEDIGITPNKEILVYCHAGVRTAHTLLVLKYILGYSKVKNYDGSWDEWANVKNPDGSYKYPVEKE